jgi:glutamate synthase (NADPH) large chain
LPPLGEYGVAMVFLPKEMVARNECQLVMERIAREYGMTVLGWRDVPVDSRHIGPTPRRTEPRIRQMFVGMGENFYNRADFNRRLYLVRQRAENEWNSTLR